MSEVIRGEVRSDLLTQRSDWVVTKWVLESEPHIFAGLEPGILWSWKSQLAAGLGVDAKDVMITGSSAVGVSLSPYNSLKSFDAESDVDVAVVSPYHFDVAWRTLRSLGTRRYKLTRAQQSSFYEHITRYIYWGTIATDKLLSILPFADSWDPTLAQMATVVPTADREVKARIYRDYASLRSYLQSGTKQLRSNLLARGSTEPIETD